MKSDAPAGGRIFVAGHNGMVGSAIRRRLNRTSGIELLTRSRRELDLRNQAAVSDFFEAERPDQVYLCAAKVGGIHANSTRPAEFIYDNLIIEANVIHNAWQSGVDRLLFLGSSCIYPRLAEQPMREEALLTGSLEPTNEPYAIAKIAGIKLCESYRRQYGADFRAVMPTNLYGPGDNFHPENSHVIPALLRRFQEALEQGAPRVEIWGTGTPRREFLHVDDMADACLKVMALPRADYEAITGPQRGHINVGSGTDCTIRDLVQTVAEVVGYEGDIVYDTGKPDGAPRKLMDSGRLASLGWEPHFTLRSGLESALAWYLANRDSARG